ncbi:MAG: hypothetical protein WC558_10720 [Patulibacter sp.]
MQLPSSRSSRPRRRALTLAVTVAAGLGIAGLAPVAASAATAEEIASAADRGADHLATWQASSGLIPGFGGDWAVASLAAAGRDADAVRPSADGPSALTAYRTLWTSGPDGDEDWTTPSGPDPFSPTRYASDYARAALISRAIGLDPTRLSADQNLVAQLAGVYHGRPSAGEDPGTGRIEGTFGDTAPLSNVVGSLFVLSRTAAPQVLLDTIADTVRSNQLDSGAWGWRRLMGPADQTDPFLPDFDMTGQAIGALCDIGVRPTDPAIVRGLDYIRDAQIANGGITNPFAPAGDVNTTSAVVFALNACGIDPQGSAWTTVDGQTPIDFLIANQITTGDDAGGFPASYAPGASDLYASQEAVRALTGSGYVAEPSRSVASPTVEDGTVVPQALAIDAGIDETGERDLRFCRVQAPVGATVSQLLELAATSAQPAGCVEAPDVVDGQLRALNGVPGDHPQRTWLVRIKGGPAQRAGVQPVCHGQIVALYVGPASDATATTTTPCTATTPVPVDPKPQPPSPVQPTVIAPTPGASKVTDPTAIAPTPRVTIAGRSGAQRAIRLDRKGRLRITLSCPKAAGTAGCWSVVSARSTYRSSPRGEARDGRVGGRTIRLAAGRTRTVTVTLNSALRRDLRRVGQRTVRLIVRTHGGDTRTTSRTAVDVRVHPVKQRG